MIHVDRSYPLFILAKRVWQRRWRLRLCDRVRDLNGLDWTVVGRTAAADAQHRLFLLAAGLTLRVGIGVEHAGGLELLRLDVSRLIRVLIEYRTWHKGVVLVFAWLVLPDNEPVLFG